jgi:RNA polymerase sigma factor (sigma-70 family)
VTHELVHELLIAFIMALIVVPIADAIFDMSTRLARRLVFWSAHRIYATNPERAAERAKEWVSGIENAPKYLRLGQASLFTGVAIGKVTHRRWRATRKTLTGKVLRRRRRVRLKTQTGNIHIGRLPKVRRWQGVQRIVRLVISGPPAFFMAERLSELTSWLTVLLIVTGAVAIVVAAAAATRILNERQSVLRHRAIVEKYAPKGQPDAPGTENGAITELERTEVIKALGELPARQREALVLRYYANLSEAEIATSMGISRGAVKSHTARGMAALRTVLEQDMADRYAVTSRRTAEP